MSPDTAQDQASANRKWGATAAFFGFLAAIAVLVGIFFLAMTWLDAHHAGKLAAFAATATYGALLMGLIVLWTRFKSAQACMPASPAARRYRGRMLLASSLYVAGLILAIFINGRLPPPTALAYVVALAPALPAAGMFVAMGLYLREETDEFQRAVQIESGLWATGGVMVLCAGWGFLEMFHLAPHVEAWAAIPVWALFLGAANALTRRRYR